MIERNDSGVKINYKGGQEEFDSVVIGTHSDQALKLIKNPTSDELNILSAIKYQKNIALIHTDESILPKRKLAWSSWNYLMNKGKDELVTLFVHYELKDFGGFHEIMDTPDINILS